MATFTKFNPFVENLAEKSFNLGADSLKIALTNSAPAATNGTLSQITEISYTNLSSRALTIASSAQTSGVYKLTINDATLVSTGGSTGPFRYIVIYDDTATNKELICFFDYGSSITLADGQSLLVDFDGTNGLLQIT